MSGDFGFAGIYDTPAPREESTKTLDDVKSNDWRNILVLGRATKDGVHPETLALVGRARVIANELGCRVEVLLIGSALEPATAELKKYPIDTIYRVAAPDYAPIDHTAKVLTEVVRKRRPELVLVFQSRTGDAVTAYTANRFGVGFVNGARRVDVDTSERKALVTQESTGKQRFHVVTAMQDWPQFVSVQRGLFRAPLEEPYSHCRVHELKVELPALAAIEVLGKRPAPAPTLATAERVVVAGARIQSKAELELVQQLAKALDARFAVTVGIVERGFAHDADLIVGVHDTHIRPDLLVTVGVRGALDFLEAVEGDPTVCAIACDVQDPIAKKAAYLVPGDVEPAVRAVLKAL